MSDSWRVERVALDVADAHGADLTATGATRLVRIHDVTRATLVLGSAQPSSHVDEPAAARLGVDVARRRSGGGAVLITPGDVLWVDVVVPADDPLWVDDVSRAFEWLGDTWVKALGSCGVAGAEVHRGPLVRTSWSDRVCFAGLGSGEVTLRGAKIVGISQRRTRHAARFQCAALRRFDATAIAALVGVPRDAVTDLARRARGVDIDLDTLAAALIDALPPSP